MQVVEVLLLQLLQLMAQTFNEMSEGNSRLGDSCRCLLQVLRLS